jgi:hypothetical protein
METFYISLMIFGGTGLLLLAAGLFHSDWKFEYRKVDERERKHQSSEAQRSDISSPARSMPAAMSSEVEYAEIVSPVRSMPASMPSEAQRSDISSPARSMPASMSSEVEYAEIVSPVRSMPAPMPSEAQRSDISSPARSMPASLPANEEVVEKIPSFSTPLHEEQDTIVTEDTTIEELQSGQHQSASDRDGNHEDQGKIANLIKQLHAKERRLSEAGRAIQRMGDRNSRLQTEVANLKHQLKASRITIQKYDAERQRLLRQLETTESMLAGSQRKGPIDRDIKA